MAKVDILHCSGKGESMKTNKLIGTALDWAVAKCEGYDRDKYMMSPDIRKDVNNKVIGIMVPNNRDYIWFRPSTDWAQAGPIIEREKISLLDQSTQAWGTPPLIWFAAVGDVSDDEVLGYRGPTPLVAAMRCYVASTLGDEVEIPRAV